MTGEYYNTTKVKGTQLKDFLDKCKTQDEQVLWYIQTHLQQRIFTPEDIYKELFKYRVPITSIRRAFNTLMNDGWIEKRNETRTGMYGKPIHTYLYAPKSSAPTIFD